MAWIKKTRVEASFDMDEQVYLAARWLPTEICTFRIKMY